MNAVARRMVVWDRTTGLYHRARCIGRVPVFFTDPGCEVRQTNLRERRVPPDCNKLLLHGCLLWPAVPA